MRTNISLLLLFFALGAFFFIPACRNNSNTDLSPTPTLVLGSATPTPEAELGTQTKEMDSDFEIQADETNGIEVLRTNFQLDGLGNLLVVGLVQNNTQLVVINPQIDVQLFDVGGVTLQQDQISTLLDHLAPGEVSPFALRIFNSPTGIHQVTINVLDYEVGEIDRAYVEPLGVLRTVDDENTIHITGELYNHNLDPIILKGLATALFLPDGEIISADNLSTPNLFLDPGEKGPFRITLIGISPDVLEDLEHALYYDAVIATPEKYYDLTISDPYAYLDQTGSFHLVGELTNNTTDALNVSLVAGIYDEGDNVLDASATTLPVSSLRPGESLPFDFNVWGPMTLKQDMPGTAVKFSIQWNPLFTSQSDSNFVDLSANNQNFTIDDRTGIFKGKITNDSDFLVSNFTIIVSLYNQVTGKIMATNHNTEFAELQATDSTQYEIQIDLPENLVMEDIDVLVIAKGKLPD